MYLILAFLLFCAFAANVVTGATGGTAPLGDVLEMLVLFAATICFVAAILRKEADARNKSRPDPKGGNP